MPSLISSCSVCGQTLGNCAIEECATCLSAENCSSKEVDSSSACIICNLALLECERRDCTLAELIVAHCNVTPSALIMACKQIMEEQPVVQYATKITRTSIEDLQAKLLEKQQMYLASIDDLRSLLELRTCPK